MTKPILATPEQIVNKAIEKFTSERPKSFKHINLGSGVYSWIFDGWRAQARLALAEVIKRVKANRRTLASGKDLVALIASEFFEEPDVTTKKAIGSVTLTRGGSMPSGVIKKGFRFVRPAAPNPPFFLTAAEYEAIEDVSVLNGQSSVTLKIQATTAGSASNTPQTSSPNNQLKIAGNIFDTKFTVSSYTAAGGCDTPTDSELRRLGKVAALGQDGPNDYAAVLGALRSNGVKYYAIHNHTDTGILGIHIADSKWGSNQTWCDRVKQYIYDQDLVGFGCRVEVEPIVNTIISVEVTVSLRDHNLLNDTTDIDAAIASSLQEYFNEREDWYVWKTGGIKSATIKANRDILNCTSVTVRNVYGAVMNEVSAGDALYHYYLPASAVKITHIYPT